MTDASRVEIGGYENVDVPALEYLIKFHTELLEPGELTTIKVDDLKRLLIAAARFARGMRWMEANDAQAETKALAELRMSHDAQLQALETISEGYYNQVQDLQRRINSPELFDFFEGVRIEAVHQQVKWGDEHDRNKTPGDWALLLDKIKGKQCQAVWDGDGQKLRHHLITMAAICFNYHHRLEEKTNTMPGV